MFCKLRNASCKYCARDCSFNLLFVHHLALACARAQLSVRSHIISINCGRIDADVCGLLSDFAPIACAPFQVHVVISHLTDVHRPSSANNTEMRLVYFWIYWRRTSCLSTLGKLVIAAMNVHAQNRASNRAQYGFVFSSRSECSFTRWMMNEWEWVKASIARSSSARLAFWFRCARVEIGMHSWVRAHLMRLTCAAAVAVALKTSCFVDNEQPLNDVIIRNALEIIVF